MIGWLQEIASVMKAGGILSLAVPDKRFTFDRERETTTLEQLLKIHFERAAEGQEGFRDHFQVFTFETFAAIIGRSVPMASFLSICFLFGAAPTRP